MEIEQLQQCGICASARLDVLDDDCNITQCCSCGYVFDNPRPSLEALIRFYSQPGKYDLWLGQADARDRLWRRRLKVLQPTKRAGSLLDIGTGIGQFLWVARDSYTDVQGTEVSTVAIEIAKQRYGLKLFQGTIENFVTCERTFDNITLFHVLEHVPEPKAVLEACYSLLSPNGIIVIAVPNDLRSLRATLRRLVVKIKLKKPGSKGKAGLPRIRLDGSIDEIHLSHFTSVVLQHLLESNGFEVVTTTLDPYQVAEGFARLLDDIYYCACLAFHRLFGANFYDAILIIARKTANNLPAMR